MNGKREVADTAGCIAIAKHVIVLTLGFGLGFGLAACGGGETSDNKKADPVETVPATTISGTAAAGVRLAGFVAARDGKGTVLNASIDKLDGSYTLDLFGMTPPVILYAAGTSNGRGYTIYSVAQTSDLGGTVNITPLTDLIVANVVGTDNEEFFNNLDLSRITDAALDAAEAELNFRLQPLLNATSVSAGFDLRTSAFNADGSGIDRVLDMLEVRVDPVNDSATITFVGDGTSITDTFPSTPAATIFNPAAATETDVLSPDAVALAGYQSVLDEVAAYSAAFFGQWADGSSPTPAEVLAYLHPDFLYNGIDGATLVPDLIPYFAAKPNITAEAFQVLGYAPAASVPNCGANCRVATVWADQKHYLWDDGSGAGWQWAGNQQLWETFLNAHAFYDQASGTFSSGIQYNSEDLAAATLQPTDYITVNGPGVSLIMTNYDDGGDVRTISGEVWLSDTQIAAIPEWSVYTFTRFSAGDVQEETYTGLLAKSPYLSTEIAADFPAITAPTAVELAAYAPGGSVTVVWTLPIGYENDGVQLNWIVSNGAGGSRTEFMEYRAPVDFAYDATTITFNEPAGLPAGDSISGIFDLNVFVRDVFRRNVFIGIRP